MIKFTYTKSFSAKKPPKFSEHLGLDDCRIDRLSETVWVSPASPARGGPQQFSGQHLMGIKSNSFSTNFRLYIQVS